MTLSFIVSAALILSGLSVASTIIWAAERIPAEGWDTVGSAAYIGLALILVATGVRGLRVLYG
jgi:hypothetical protein